MNSPHYILLPVSPAFIATSLIVAFFLNFFPWGGILGVPDFVALVLVFWSIHQPRKIGIGVAFTMGLLMDIHSAIHLGEHALVYTLLSYLAIAIHRRVLWFHPLMQSAHVFPLFVFAQGTQIVVRLLVSPEAKFPGWLFFSESLVTALLWPVVTWLLLAPQRRAVDKDHTRPI
jgi:rod shape-determining protein MreD